MSHPFTDIVVPVHNAPEETKACLETIQQHTSDYRFILVDDCSDDATTQMLLAFGKTNPSTVLLRSNTQRWFTRAVNFGLRMVRSSRCVVINSDCVVDRGWLEELYDVWDACQQQNPSRAIGLVGSVLSEEEPRRFEETREPGYVTAHCWLVSMDALGTISANRGMPGIYLNEIEQGCIHIHSDRIGCYEMNRLGLATIQSFKAAVGHKGGRSWHYDLGRVSGLRIKDHHTGEVIDNR